MVRSGCRYRFPASFAAIVVVLLWAPTSFAQQLPPEVAVSGYPDTIFFNGKVVSMDDNSRSTDPGHIYQAVAVKGDKIQKLGTNDEVRGIAGPNTRLMDLKGRLLLPGIIGTHEHIYGGATRYAERFGYDEIATLLRN